MEAYIKQVVNWEDNAFEEFYLQMRSKVIRYKTISLKTYEEICKNWQDGVKNFKANNVVTEQQNIKLERLSNLFKED
ncbi:MAG: hypothetical protein AB9856_07575 [Cellulosilyticaceae bacterium]